MKKVIYKIVFIIFIIGIFIYFSFPLEKRINLGLDLKGGMHLLLKVDTKNLSVEAKKDALERALEIIRNRIDEFGVREPLIHPQGQDEIVVQLPGITERERALEVIKKTAFLEFKLVDDDNQKLKDALEGKIPEGYELKYTPEDNEPLLLQKETSLTGEDLITAEVKFGEFAEPVVGLKFNVEGTKKFKEITEKNLGKRLAIVLDGKVQSAPRIKEPIPNGEAIITGRFTLEEAKDLALVLRIGALPAPMYIEEERTIAPLLGQDSIKKGIKASFLGGTLVFIFMAIYYLIGGVIANIALLLNLIIILGTLGLLPILFPGAYATLTLPGIAGIALSLGMAVDANVLINERIKEEIKSGKTLRSAIISGYSKAFSAILDSNLTTLIAAFFLFQFGTGPIRGFAVTLTIGILSSMFTAIFVTRTIFELLVSLNILKNKLYMLDVIKDTHIDFIGKRKIFYFLSSLVIILGMVNFFSKGKNAYGIDFIGGQIQEYRFKTPPSIETLRKTLSELKISNFSIQQFKDNPEFVNIKTPIDISPEEITKKLIEKFPQDSPQLIKIEKVGPSAGRLLKKKAILAVMWALFGILIYVGFRFKHLNFAVAGIIALFHDILVTLGFLSFTNRPIDLLSITAFLTIAGYSINDTIVIYDRVREKASLLKKKTLSELINLSVNETLSRTLFTTLTTVLVVLSIFLFGGEVLNNFSFSLLVGFISGVYSTIYIASPLVLAFRTNKP